jgi:DNA-binding response OmpR family regulator
MSAALDSTLRPSLRRDGSYALGSTLRPEGLASQMPMIFAGDKAVQLSRNEWLLADLLIEHFGRPTLRQWAVDRLYSDDPHGGPLNIDRVLDVMMKRIRQAFLDADFPLLIITIRSIGWRMVARKERRS